MIQVLMIGDVFGRPGRETVSRLLPGLRRERGLDLVVANGENAAGGLGITAAEAKELFAAGVDVITSGNHIWQQKEVFSYLAAEPRLLRPANYPAGNPGRGFWRGEVAGVAAAVVSLQGRVFLDPVDDPFAQADQLLQGPLQGARLVLVDFHAEASSEKQALGRYLAGRVSAVVGTHTHVPTADARLLPGGTAYQTDLGMTGPHDSVIGVRPEAAVARFLTQRPLGFRVARGDERLQGALITIEPTNGRATAIERLDLPLPA